MRVLLDTHLLLWAVTDDPALGENARAILLNPDHQIHVSTASIWEVAIKHRKNPTVMPMNPDLLIDACTESGFQWLEIRLAHIRTTATLRLLHQDPFDRLLIAQAIEEPMRLLTRDRQVAAYSDLIQLV